MAYTVKVTSTKPDGTKWYSAVKSRVKMRRYKAQLRKSPVKPISVSTNRPNKNTIVKVMVFDSQTAFNEYMAYAEQNLTHKDKDQYNAANGINVVTEVI